MAQQEYITVAEAREILGVSKPRMAELLKQQPPIFRVEPNPLDKRSKLLLRREVEAMAAKAGRAKKDAA